MEFARAAGPAQRSRARRAPPSPAARAGRAPDPSSLRRSPSARNSGLGSTPSSLRVRETSSANAPRPPRHRGRRARGIPRGADGRPYRGATRRPTAPPRLQRRATRRARPMPARPPRRRVTPAAEAAHARLRAMRGRPRPRPPPASRGSPHSTGSPRHSHLLSPTAELEGFRIRSDGAFSQMDAQVSSRRRPGPTTFRSSSRACRKRLASPGLVAVLPEQASARDALAAPRPDLEVR